MHDFQQLPFSTLGKLSKLQIYYIFLIFPYSLTFHANYLSMLEKKSTYNILKHFLNSIFTEKYGLTYSVVAH